MAGSDIRKTVFSDRALPWLFFFTTSGYYLIMLIMFELGFNSQSRLFTVPVRLLTVVIGIIIISKQRTILQKDRLFAFLCIYVFAYYLTRMVYDLNFQGFHYFMGSSEYYLYTISHFGLPLFFMTATFSLEAWQKSKHYVLKAAVFVSVLGFIFYRERFAQGYGRLKGVDEEDIILSPLAISYVCLVPLAYYSFELLKGNFTKKKLLTSLVYISLSMLGVFMGASRGSILAYILVIVILSLAKGYKARLLVFTGILALILPVVVSLSNDFGSSLFDRVLHTVDETKTGKYLENDRPYLWKNAIENFSNSPILGDLIENRGIGHHPHNIIIEAFMAMGVLGGIPFVILLGLVFKYLFYIAKRTNTFDWLLIFFLLSFSQNMVSGSIWSAVWLWTASGSIIGIYYQIKYKNVYKINSDFTRDSTGVPKTAI